MILTVDRSSLKQSKIFEYIPEIYLKNLPWDLAERSYESNDVIFEEGAPGDAMFIIDSGRVKISQKVGQEENVLAIMGEGEFFGEMAFLDGGPRSATATALEKTALLEIESGAFDKSLREKNNIASQVLANIARAVSERLRTTDSRLAVLYEKIIEMEKRLEELKLDFISMLSRELRAPLADIQEESETDR